MVTNFSFWGNYFLLFIFGHFFCPFLKSKKNFPQKNSGIPSNIETALNTLNKYINKSI